MPAKSITIAGRSLGAGAPCFVIAEAGVNHNGDPRLAKEMVRIAAAAGADAVKFQTFTADRLATPDSPKDEYQAKATDETESQLEMLRRLELPRAAYPELIKECREFGITFLSTPFDEESADFLGSLGMEAFKIPSGEITNLPFLEYVARKGKPMIVSTGMSTLDEVRAAVRAIYGAGNSKLVLLHCVSSYPAHPKSVNLRAMATLAEEFQIPVGYSDHTLGTDIAIAAVALGACVIEKHFTTSRSLPGPDQLASVEPEELGALIEGIRAVETSLGTGMKAPTASEVATAAVARKSLVAALAIPNGTLVTNDLIAVMRPGTGLPPAARTSIVGRRATRDIEAGTVLTSEMFE